MNVDATGPSVESSGFKRIAKTRQGVSNVVVLDPFAGALSLRSKQYQRLSNDFWGVNTNGVW